VGRLLGKVIESQKDNAQTWDYVVDRAQLFWVYYTDRHRHIGTTSSPKGCLFPTQFSDRLLRTDQITLPVAYLQPQRLHCHKIHVGLRLGFLPKILQNFQHQAHLFA
jgi:hypothetical protein